MCSSDLDLEELAEDRALCLTHGGPFRVDPAPVGRPVQQRVNIHVGEQVIFVDHT